MPFFQIHHDFDSVREDRYNPSAYKPTSLTNLWLQTIGVLAVGYGIYLSVDGFRMAIPQIPAQYPTQGKTHYTFELEGDS